MKMSVKVRVAMAELGIKNAVELSKLSGVAYTKVVRLLKDDGTVRLVDAHKIVSSLGLNLSVMVNNNESQ